MWWQISSPLLVLVLALAAHQCAASCFGKDAHFKTTDVSLSVSVVKKGYKRVFPFWFEDWGTRQRSRGVRVT